MEKIEFNKVSFSPKKRVVLKDINFSIAKGEFFMIKNLPVLEGRLLLEMMHKSINPTKGEVVLHKEEGDFIGTNITPFIKGFTLRQNLTLPLIAKDYNKEQTRQKIIDVSKYFSLESALDRKIESLEDSKRELAGIARALIAEPSILLLTEFTSKLPHKLAVLVMTYLHELCVDYDVTIALIENDSKLHPFASKILHLSNGSIKDLVGEGVDIERLMPFLKI